MRFSSITPALRRRFVALGLGSLALIVGSIALIFINGGSRHGPLDWIGEIGIGTLVRVIGGNAYEWRAFSLLNLAVFGATCWLYVNQDRWSRKVSRIAFAAAIPGILLTYAWLPHLAEFFTSGSIGSMSGATTAPVVLVLTALLIAPLIFRFAFPALRAHNRFLANPAPGFQRAEYRHWLTSLHPRRGVADRAWVHQLDSFCAYRVALRILGQWACARHLASTQRASSAVAEQRAELWREISPIMLSRHPNAATLIPSGDVVTLIAAMREVMASTDGFGPDALRVVERAKKDDPFALTRETVNVIGVIAGMGMMDQCLNGFSPSEAPGMAQLNNDTSWPAIGTPA